ncbi:DUF1955 domain-containing protein [Acidianus sulfidivorans JP7]|uniref:DUF1955 domain-containing protein n=1 Tax=Acidianus sulfidivorans JP7 TaxID=619593 RepID=A0A2U9IKN4_9CREN|nr:DUF1955 domain-containing protein [Acidianus sulfidivorans]AWR96580.1 DUF1955 domain-containing protein [Acidianus sulfidivorans JP7]
MGTDTRELIKSLTQAKTLIVDGFVKQGIEIIEKSVTSENIKQSNWVICNIIDAASCDAIVEVLDSIGKMFDISVCGNVKRVISCYAKQGKYSEFVDIAIDSIVQRGKKDQLDKILPYVNKSGIILYKLSEAYRKLNDVRTANELKRKACENGITEACENINQVSTSFS